MILKESSGRPTRFTDMGALYKLTFPSGKCYIGITTQTPEIRFKRHVISAKSGKRDYPVLRAIMKYGPENVVIETLAIENDISVLRKIESEAVQKYGTLCPEGYNLTGGGGESGFWCQQTVEKASASNKRFWAGVPIEERRRRTESQVKAMAAAMNDPVRQRTRIEKIKTTMNSENAKIARGSGRPNSKLCEDDVVLILEMIWSGRTTQSIAADFGVARSLINGIKNAKRWKHVIESQSL